MTNNKTTVSSGKIISDFGFRPKKNVVMPTKATINHAGKIKKPLSTSLISTHKTKARNIEAPKSTVISKFSHHISNSQANLKSVAETIKSHSRHPLAQKADKVIEKKRQAVQPKTAKQIKEDAINQAFEKLAAQERSEGQKLKKSHKIINIISITIAVLFILAIIYLTYINIPVLSVNIASAQAGISATFPEYSPENYSLDGPVTHADGEVLIKFRSNDNNGNFVLKQSKSSWDSTAVKEKVMKDSNGQFITTEERGLTIFTYKGKAAWVNGGILYTIDGDADLSSDQIRRIATSL